MADSQNPPLLVAEEEEGGKGLSKKAAKKEALKAEKAMRRQQEEAAAAAAASLSLEADPLAGNYGDTPLADLQSKEVSGGGGRRSSRCRGVEGRGGPHPRPGTDDPSRRKEHGVRGSEADGLYCAVRRHRRSGARQPPDGEVCSGAQQRVDRRRPRHRHSSRSPHQRSITAGLGRHLSAFGQDTRLNYRVLDIRTPANQGIFRIQSQVGLMFRQFFLAENFVEIHTPKLIAGSSEGGSAVFKLEYKGQPACLAQSPQLHKQMSICGDFGRVFEIGPVFRAEDSYTHRHLCEFTGLDVEMEIKEHYFECKKELDAIAKQYPFKPLKYLRKTLNLTFQEGVQMLKEAGIEVDPLGDLNTESERKLGQLVLEKYDTEFYILHRYPLAVRPFYTMPCYEDPTYSNSFDVFIRGEEIISGAQRVHVPELLTARAEACGIDVKTISTYVDSFRYGAPPHGGFGVGLERVVMLFLALNNIRKTSLFPRDPMRLAP
ncbi:Aspartyl/Asparaginyl-tRNA synthetase [Cinnamomum micranthum f. kanehirae]|uniref:aspartate--tRNA ligase n=1 Tax=Cinnamomum micranthum f. kanehirae TaxID=337451 RepID=A0A3S3MLB8_9MAGN|nr:Aspartyl/Asparaginyl-tRNA synthetase [Cinnamomum micranthum f. kanehirae]